VKHAELAALAKASPKKTVTVTYEGLEFDVVFDPFRYTPVMESELEAASGEGGGPGRALRQLVLALVSDWGLRRGGRKVPLTEEGVAGVPVVVLDAIAGAVRDQSSVDPTTASSSNGGAGSLA
jgi:hypothetical protein